MLATGAMTPGSLASLCNIADLQKHITVLNTQHRRQNRRCLGLPQALLAAGQHHKQFSGDMKVERPAGVSHIRLLSFRVFSSEEMSAES